MARWLYKVPLRFRSLFRTDRVEQELAEELRFHLEKLIEENLQNGCTREEARYAALRELGGLDQIKEECREARRVNYIESLIHDVRYGLRMLVKNRGFTTVAVLTLALGIGANTAIFSVVHAVLLRPLPYRDPGRLISVYETDPAQGWFMIAVAPANFMDLREQNTVFEDMAAITEANLTLMGGGEPEKVQGQRVSANLFSILGVQPAVGRTFLPEENRPGGDSVAILSHGLWQRRFGADPALVGKMLTFDGQSYTVIGVMPRAFRFNAGFWEEPRNVDVWLPNPFKEERLSDRWAHMHYVVARLKAGASVEQAKAEMDTIARRLREAYPEMWAGWGLNLIPLASDLTQYVRRSVLVLVGAAGFVLLLACANVANLLLARAATRQKEIAVRAAIGASRWRLIRQMLTESVLLGMMGGAVGLMIAVWGVDALVGLSPANIPRRDEIRIDAWVLGFTLLITLLTGLIFGLAPALAGSNPNLNESLKDAGRVRGESLRRPRLRSFLVVSELAAAMVLLMGAGLMINSFLRLHGIALGFNPDNVLAVQIDLAQFKYYRPSGIGKHEPRKEDGLSTKGRELWTVRPQEAEFMQEVLRRIQALPGVISAAKINFIPVYGWHYPSHFTVEGRPPVTPEESWQQFVRFLTVTPDYFRTMGIPLLAGRQFTEKDMVETPGVAIIDETMARRFFPKEDPIGKRLMVEDKMEDGERLHEVVGIVGSVPQDRLDKNLDPAIYVPQPQQDRTYVDYQLKWRRHVSFVLRTASNPIRLAQAVRKAVWEVDPDQPIQSISTMGDFLSDTLKERRFMLLLLAIFAAVGLILATVGIYGVISYSMAQRTHEIGVRMALGAARRDVLMLVVGQGMVLVLIGALAGTAGAFGLTRFMMSMLYGVRPTDTLTFVSVSMLLVAVGFLACYIPARRAAKVDPIVALRHE